MGRYWTGPMGPQAHLDLGLLFKGGLLKALESHMANTFSIHSGISLSLVQTSTAKTTLEKRLCIMLPYMANANLCKTWWNATQPSTQWIMQV